LNPGFPPARYWKKKHIFRLPTRRHFSLKDTIAQFLLGFLALDLLVVVVAGYE